MHVGAELKTESCYCLCLEHIALLAVNSYPCGTLIHRVLLDHHWRCASERVWFLRPLRIRNVCAHPCASSSTICAMVTPFSLRLVGGLQEPQTIGRVRMRAMSVHAKLEVSSPDQASWRTSKMFFFKANSPHEKPSSWKPGCAFCQISGRTSYK